jgi:hypothetical protein
VKVIPSLIGLLLISACAFSRAALADNWGHPMNFELIPKTVNNMFSGTSMFNSDRSAILGDGDIKPDTAAILEQFLIKNRIPPNTEIHLNSRGGNLAAGLNMGRIIRAHGLHTWVGGYDQWAHRSFDQMSKSAGRDRYLAYCVSSCTLAFLGGVERRTDGSTYAVHQAKFECEDPNILENRLHTNVRICPTVASAMIGMQSILGEVIAYVSEMGVDPHFVVEMTKADPETSIL